MNGDVLMFAIVATAALFGLTIWMIAHGTYDPDELTPFLGRGMRPPAIPREWKPCAHPSYDWTQDHLGVFAFRCERCGKEYIGNHEAG